MKLKWFFYTPLPTQHHLIESQWWTSKNRSKKKFYCRRILLTKQSFLLMIFESVLCLSIRSITLEFRKCSFRWIYVPYGDFFFWNLAVEKICSPNFFDLYRVHHFLIPCNAWLPLQSCVVVRSACQFMTSEINLLLNLVRQRHFYSDKKRQRHLSLSDGTVGKQ